MDYKFVPMLDFRQVRIIPVKSSNVNSRKQCDTSVVLPGMPLAVPVIVPAMHALFTPELARNVEAVGSVAVYPRFKEDFRINQYPDQERIIINSSMETANLVAQALSQSRIKHKVLSIEIANGHMAKLADKVSEIKDKYPEIIIWAGTVITPEAVENLAEHGADAVLIGIGVGSACTTTPMTGVGLPAFATTMLCAQAGHPIILTGGIREPGDIAKAIAIGADAVYIGAMVKGALDTASKTEYWGEASIYEKNDNAHIEGRVETIVPKSVRSSDIIVSLREHLQSSMSYCGAFSITEFRNNATFAEVRQ